MRIRLASALESSRGKEGQETTEESTCSKDQEAESGERDMNLERVGKRAKQGMEKQKSDRT